MILALDNTESLPSSPEVWVRNMIVGDAKYVSFRLTIVTYMQNIITTAVLMWLYVATFTPATVAVNSQMQMISVSKFEYFCWTEFIWKFVHRKYFAGLTVFLSRIALAQPCRVWYWYSNSVCLSICPSVCPPYVSIV